MGLFGSAGLKSAASSVAQIVAALVGQDIVARAITLTGATPVTAANGPISGQKFTQTGGTGPGYSSAVNAGQYAFFDANINGGIASGTNILTLQVAGANAFQLGASAAIVGAGLALAFTSYTDDSATPGNRTVNSARGKNAFAIGSPTVTITNSFVTVNSQVLVSLEFADATLNTIRTVIPGAGSFVVTGNANATAATKFSWLVIN